MSQGGLESILREIKGENVKDPDIIRQYVQDFGNRTLFSLMHGEKERCSAQKRYESWSYLEFVLLAYADLADLSEEEIERCMRRITVKDFLCLAEHLNDRRAGPRETGAIRDGVTTVYTRELAFARLLKLILRAKGRGDEDVNNFCLIHVNSLMTWTRTQNDQLTVADILYLLKDELKQDRASCMSLNSLVNRYGIYFLRGVLVKGVEQNACPEGFSLPETIGRCREMGRGDS